MNKIISLLMMITILLTASCTTESKGHALSAAAGVTTGALAYKLTEGKSKDAQLLWTAGTALTTFAFGEYINSQVKLSMEEKYALGYKFGMAESAKINYELIQNLQKGARRSPAVRYRTYELPMNNVDKDGVKLAPHTIKLRVRE
jgi:hypothetical protein